MTEIHYFYLFMPDGAMLVWDHVTGYLIIRSMSHQTLCTKWSELVTEILRWTKVKKIDSVPITPTEFSIYRGWIPINSLTVSTQWPFSHFFSHQLWHVVTPPNNAIYVSNERRCDLRCHYRINQEFFFYSDRRCNDIQRCLSYCLTKVVAKDGFTKLTIITQLRP